MATFSKGRYLPGTNETQVVNTPGNFGVWQLPNSIGGYSGRWQPGMTASNAAVDAMNITPQQLSPATRQLNVNAPVAEQAPVPTSTYTAPEMTYTPPAAQEESPITKFNQALLRMLEQAQKGTDNSQLFQQQEALQREGINRVSQMTPEELRDLSPEQQRQIRSGSVTALEPESDYVAAAIKARDNRLSNFESVLNTARQLGGDIMSSIAPSKEVIGGYKAMILAGANMSSVPDEVLNKVMETMTPEDIKKWEVMNTKARSTSSGGGTVKEEKPETPLSILDIQRYQELYPDSGIVAGDTETTANEKVNKSNSPEGKTEALVIAAKDNGNDYNTVINEINNDATIKDKAMAISIAKKVYGIQEEPGFSSASPWNQKTLEMTKNTWNNSLYKTLFK